MKTIDVPVPKTLHELLALALSDFDRIKDTPGYKIDMGNWMFKDNDGICHVCLAGCAMVGTLGLATEEAMWPCETSPEWHPLLLALNFLRCGRIGAATNVFYREFKLVPNSMYHVTEYEDNPLKWRADMDKLLISLRGLNL